MIIERDYADETQKQFKLIQKLILIVEDVKVSYSDDDTPTDMALCQMI